jgi:hypothetical protein
MELKILKPTNNNKQQNTMKVNTLKSIAKYYNGALFVRIFSFCSFLKHDFF